MDDVTNPYLSPKHLEEHDLHVRPAYPASLELFLIWLLVFVANLVVPILFGWELTADGGRLGLVLALMAMYGGGWCFCVVYPSLGRKLIAGAVLTAMSQIVPIAQIIVGSIALRITARLGLAVEDSELGVRSITGELGGFLVTILVGAFFLVAALGIGWCAAFLMPRDWFEPATSEQRHTAA